MILLINLGFVSSSPQCCLLDSELIGDQTDPVAFAGSSDITFDFDTTIPVLSVGQGTPLDQTSGGVTAHFSSPSDPAFSVQNHDTTFFVLSQFSSNYLYPNNMNRNPLDITFSQPLASITVVFATVEYRDQVEVPSNITLTAFTNSTRSVSIGSSTTRGTFANDTFPMGTLTFASNDKQFSSVEIVVPYNGLGASTFLMDNITVTPVNTVPEFSSVTPLSLLLLAIVLAIAVRKSSKQRPTKFEARDEKEFLLSSKASLNLVLS